MAQRGPLVTAIVAVGGLVGLMTANAAGGLVTAAGPSPEPTQVGATQNEQPPADAPEAPAETEETPPAPAAPPVETSEVPTTEDQPVEAVFPAEAVYAGKGDGSKLYIAVAVKGDDASAYLCDGNAVESWLKGTAKDGVVELASADGANTLTATLEGDSLVGTATTAAETVDFTIAFAPAPAGLYRGADGQTTVGWIVLPDGTQVGIADGPGGTEPAPPLNTTRGGVTLDGAFVAAKKVNGETRFG
jgi:hypothetical protein